MDSSRVVEEGVAGMESAVANQNSNLISVASEVDPKMTTTASAITPAEANSELAAAAAGIAVAATVGPTTSTPKTDIVEDTVGPLASAGVGKDFAAGERMMSASRRMVSASGRMVSASGRMVSASGRMVSAGGRANSAMGGTRLVGGSRERRRR